MGNTLFAAAFALVLLVVFDGGAWIYVILGSSRDHPTRSIWSVRRSFPQRGVLIVAKIVIGAMVIISFAAAYSLRAGENLSLAGLSLGLFLIFAALSVWDSVRAIRHAHSKLPPADRSGYIRR